jgi:hypothetical protein
MNQNPGLYLATPAWRDSQEICALADGERHLGHVIKIGGRWHAFDATHFNDESNGFRSVGTFASISAAKEALESSLRPAPISLAGAA